MHILLKSPEITLKGRNQGDFWNQLRSNVKRYLRSWDWPSRVETARARLYVQGEPKALELEKALETLSWVSGVDAIAAAKKIDRQQVLVEGALDRELVEDTMVAMAQEAYEPDLAFAIRAHRVDKRYPMSSPEMEVWLGNAIRERTPWERVQLENPDRTFSIDMYPDGMFFYSDRRKGIGGLPVGTSGRVLSLLSGGIDSPVASFLLARRGCIVDWFHVSATHLEPSDFSESVVGRIASRLSRHTMCSRLFTVPYTHFDLALSGRDTGYEPVLFRRFLFRVAEELGLKIGSAALVTGDSLGQVASQTLENLIASAKSIDAPLLRPLVGLGKQEIMDLAKQIGTYEISIEPYKDCCALYSRNARTKTLDAALTVMEERIIRDYRSVITRTLEDVMWGEYECGELVEVHRDIGELSRDLPLLQEHQSTL